MGVGEECSVDDVGESAFEGSDGFSCWCCRWRFAGQRSGALGGWLLAWVRAMRWMAALSWRLPARLRRCLWVLPDHTGSGAVPLWRAYACRERNRSMRGGLADDLGGCECADAV